MQAGSNKIVGLGNDYDVAVIEYVKNASNVTILQWIYEREPY